MSSLEYREAGDQEQEEGFDRASGRDAELPDAAADWAQQQPSDQSSKTSDQQADQVDQGDQQVDQVGEGGAALVEGTAKDWDDGADPAIVTADANPPAENGDAQASADADSADPPTEVEADVDEPGRRPVLDKAGREEQLRETDYSLTKLETDDGNCNDVYKAALANGDAAYFKPGSGEATKPRDSIPDASQFRREVATYELDQALGFDLVPTTVFRTDADHGPGSLQAEAPIPRKDGSEYDQSDRMKMAVLDYVAGNTDRHENNYRTQADGRPAATDNGMAFPEDASDPIRSTWVTEALGKDIEPDTVAQARAVDRDQLAGNLRACGLDDKAVDGALRRLEEVQKDGSISGRAWDGKICDASWKVHVG